MFLGMTLVQFLIVAVVVIACCALFGVFLRQTNFPIPGWLLQVFWIVVAAIIVIVAIKVVAGLL